jgi:hypothetical protein
MQPEGGYLSRTFVTKCLKRFADDGTGKRPTLVPPTLHPTGVYRASTSRCCWCALTAPLHPYLYQSSVISHQSSVFLLLTFGCELSIDIRRYVSVALSSRSLALGITQQVWSFGCPDFPQIEFPQSATTITYFLSF